MVLCYSRPNFCAHGICLSDGEVEEQVNDRLSFSRFVSSGLNDCTPDSATVMSLPQYFG